MDKNDIEDAIVQALLTNPEPAVEERETKDFCINFICNKINDVSEKCRIQVLQNVLEAGYINIINECATGVLFDLNKIEINTLREIYHIVRKGVE